MKKYVRGKVLAGQIISVAAFAYLALSSFILSYAAGRAGLSQIESMSIWIGFIRLAEVVIAIFGIVHSVAPYGKFSKGTAITSAIFNGVSGLILFIVLFQPANPLISKGTDAVFMVLLFTAMGLLIAGTVEAKKESIHSLQAQTPSNKRFDEDFVPLAIPPQPRLVEPVAPSVTSPEMTKTASDLASLKTLFEQQLINEQEYTEKKKEILNRDFAGK